MNRFTLPEAALGYRRIGPFTSANLPRGLLREHRLKEGSWGKVDVTSGSIGFVWDDDADEGAMAVVVAGQTIIVPPMVPHHLQSLGEDFGLEIEFLSEASGTS